MAKLTIDFETRSAAPLKKCGAAAYAADPTTEVICLAMKWSEMDPVIWFAPPFQDAIHALPATVHVASASLVTDWVNRAEVIEAHNAQFEYFIWKYVMPRYGFKMFDKSKLRCSAAKAAMFGLPRDLAGACAALGVPQQKDIEGSKLMLRLCKPRAARKDEKLADPDWEKKLYWHGSPEEFAREGQYCMQDVRAEEALSEALPDLPEYEQRVWHWDLDVNDRGIRVDIPTVHTIIDLVEEHSAKLTANFRKLTGLQSPKQRDATLQHLLALGVQMDGLRAKDVEHALSVTEDGTAKEILEIRKSLSKSSTAKYQAFVNSVCPDDRVRGALMYHGAGTGRWSGRLIQPQNFPRGAFGDVDNCIDLFKLGDLESVELFYGDPMVAASTCIRGMIIPSEGNDFICADYSSVEGRVLAWLAGEETALNVYRDGIDPYKTAASAIYGVPYEGVTKKQRQVGKVAELACIAEGQEVLTDRGLIPIQDVTTDHRVWDGERFVHHDGVVYKGVKEVIEYDGLTATEDHFVWVEGKHEPIPFGIAASRGARLVRFDSPREEIRVDRGRLRGETLVEELESMLYSGKMHRLWHRLVALAQCLDDGEVERLSKMLSSEAGATLAGGESDRSETEVYESERSGVPELRWPGHHVRLSLCHGSLSLDNGEHRITIERDGNRPDRQQQGIYTWQYPVGDTAAESWKPTSYRIAIGGFSVTVAFVDKRGAEVEASRDEPGANLRARETGGEGTPKKLAVHRGKVRVYDVLNAGPNHRFTVSGRLVHNCGYQGSVGAFNAMAVNYGVSLPEKEVKDIVNRWRDHHPETVRLWAELEKACTLAVEKPGNVFVYRSARFAVRTIHGTPFLAMRLPSGRCLWYCRPRMEFKEMSWGEQKLVVAFDGVNSLTKKFGTQYLYGGLLAENLTQATARDLLVNGMLNVERHGYEVVMHVHDEAVAEVPEARGDVAEFENLLCDLPSWAEGLPLKAEGWRGKRYKK